MTRRDVAVTALVRGDAAARAVTSLGAAPVRGALTDLNVLREAARAPDGAIHQGWDASADTAQVDHAAATALQDGAGPGRRQPGVRGAAAVGGGQGTDGS